MSGKDTASNKIFAPDKKYDLFLWKIIALNLQSSRTYLPEQNDLLRRKIGAR